MPINYEGVMPKAEACRLGGMVDGQEHSCVLASWECDAPDQRGECRVRMVINIEEPKPKRPKWLETTEGEE